MNHSCFYNRHVLDHNGEGPIRIHHRQCTLKIYQTYFEFFQRLKLTIHFFIYFDVAISCFKVLISKFKTPVLDFRLSITALFENRGARTPRRICRLKFRWLRKTCNNIERRHDIKKLNFAYEHFFDFGVSQ